jgi:hypothetical protein
MPNTTPDTAATPPGTSHPPAGPITGRDRRGRARPGRSRHKRPTTAALGLALVLAVVAVSPASAAPGRPGPGLPTPNPWRSGHPGIYAHGGLYYANHRTFIYGTVKDTLADGHAARLYIVFKGAGFGQRRDEYVQVGGAGRSGTFAFNSQYPYVEVRACTHSYLYESCGAWTWL